MDLETGKVRVLDLRMAAYAGRVIHPTYAELQVEGNAAFGVGQALMEEMIYDGGQLVNANLGEYLVPSLLDMPPTLEVQLVEDPAVKARSMVSAKAARRWCPPGHRQRGLCRLRRGAGHAADHARTRLAISAHTSPREDHASPARQRFDRPNDLLGDPL